MKMLTNYTVKINCPKNEVYNFVVNMENYKLWFPEVVDIKSNNSLEHGSVGKQYSEIVKVPFKGDARMCVEVVKADKDNVFITEANFSPLLPRMTVQFSELENQSTSLTWIMQSRSTNFVFNALFLPFIKKQLRKRAKIGLLTLKGILEN